ncbi:MAG: efflux transporter periplasmic adaptor subunit [Gammaproteobacteria bacterium]|nr:MAG: efflux transporter periplasmic adaptor subunit [Gammaproteobacteria bacterium]
MNQNAKGNGKWGNGKWQPLFYGLRVGVLSVLTGIVLQTPNVVLAEHHSSGEHEDHQAHTDLHQGHSDHDQRNSLEGQGEHAGHDDHKSQSEHDGHDKHEQGVSLSPAQIKLANIKLQTLMPRLMDYQIYAPGEIKANAYSSYSVSPRVDSMVLRRHVALGDHVEKGQPLVTLFSTTVAEVQGRFGVANSEWLRVKKLGRKTVGDKRYITAQADYEVSFGRLKSFGFDAQQIESLVGNKTIALGEYTLNAEISGTVLQDDFKQGQRMGAGDSLMELVDEHELWVDARLAPNRVVHLPAGTEAQVQVGADWFVAKVVREAHAIDPQTRTRVVRLIIDNASHRLHPGLFVDVYFSFKTEHPVLAVPESALIRSADGDWIVFVEDHPNEFQAVEVGVGQALGEWREIFGIQKASRVVTEGAFFVASQIAKGGFDPHNH